MSIALTPVLSAPSLAPTEEAAKKPSDFPPRLPATSLADITLTVRRLFVERFNHIVADYNRRMTTPNRETLEAGVWYANDYLELLQTLGCKARLEYLRDKDACYGYPPTGFVQPPDGNSPCGRAPFTYHVKRGEKRTPLDLLQTITMPAPAGGKASFWFLECSSATQLAMYQTVATLLGTAAFNALFSGERSLKFSPNMEQTPLFTLGLTTVIRSQDDLGVGHGVFFANIRLYVSKHPVGEMGGLHAVCISPLGTASRNRRYIAFGGPSPETGFTAATIKASLIAAFNAAPLNPKDLVKDKHVENIAAEFATLEQQFRALDQRIRNAMCDPQPAGADLATATTTVAKAEATDQKFREPVATYQLDARRVAALCARAETVTRS